MATARTPLKSDRFNNLNNQPTNLCVHYTYTLYTSLLSGTAQLQLKISLCCILRKTDKHDGDLFFHFLSLVRTTRIHLLCNLPPFDLAETLFCVFAMDAYRHKKFLVFSQFPFCFIDVQTSCYIAQVVHLVMNPVSLCEWESLPG